MLGEREEYVLFGGRPEWNEKSKKFGIPTNSPFKETATVVKEHIFEVLKEWQGRSWSVWVSLNDKEDDRIEGVKAIHVIWFDFDSPRKSKAIPATEFERKQALAEAEKFRKFMKEKYHAVGFLACSGNGFHLFYPVNRFQLPGKNFRKEFNRKQGAWMKNLKKESGINFDTTTDIRRVTQPIGFPNMKIPGKPIDTYWIDEFTHDDVVEARRKNAVLINAILDTEIKEEFIPEKIEHPKFEELIKDNEKMRDLYNGEWKKHGYPTRSEAEQALVTFLCANGFTDDEIHRIMMSCGIGKWRERGDAYRRITIQKGRQFVAQEEAGIKESKKKSKKIKMEDILAYLFEEYRFITTEDTEEIYYYDEGVYKMALPKIKSEVENILGENASTHIVDEVIGHIKRRTYTSREVINSNKNYMPVKNGLLNLTTLKLEPFDPEKIFTFKLDIEYKEGEDCPMFKEFLSQIVRKEEIPTIQEYMGYLLLPDMPSRKTLWLYGVGSNGKTTLVNTIKGLLGSENVISIPLEELDGSHRFAVAEFYGKLLNAVSEPATKKAMETVLFKKLTGGDWIVAEKKNKQRRIGFHNFAKFIIYGNKYPQVRDTTPAFWDRLIVIEFPYRFTGSKSIKYLHKKILKKEKSGILNFMLEGLKRLMENDFNFTESKSTERMKIEFKRISSSGESFLEEMVKKDPDSVIPKEELWNRYKDYCEYYDLPNLGKGEFTKVVLRLPYAREKIMKINGKSTRCWSGISVISIEELESKNEEKAEIEFIKDYSFGNLIYRKGQVVEVDEDLSEELISSGVAKRKEREETHSGEENDGFIVVRSLDNFSYVSAGLGKDMVIRKEDVLTLPEEEAKILIKAGKLEVIK